jgi:uncharacterized membrane-anchored protein
MTTVSAVSPAVSPPGTALVPSSTWAKVPALVALFWVVKILTTGMGESASDYLAHWGIYVPGVLGALGLTAALVWQFRTPGYRALPYWTTVAMVAIFGTVAADGMRQLLGVSLPLLTTAYAAALAAVLLTWRQVEGTLSVHSITTHRREAFYWLTVLLSFALGTAAGDLTAFDLGWGFTNSIAVFAVAILIPWALHRAGLLGEVAAFWSAYILTRPLGATVADWLGKPSGAGLGDGTVTLAALGVIAVLVGYLAVRRPDVQPAHDVQPALDRVA